MRVTLYDGGLTDVEPVSVDVTWEQLVELLSDFAPPKCSVAGEGGLPPCAGRACPAKDSPAWSPHEIEPGKKRGNGSVSAITAAAFDLDHVADLEAVKESLRGYSYALHTTHSHSESDPCWRLVMPLSRPATPSEWAVARPAVVEAFQIPADPKARDLSRLFFRPAHRAGVSPGSASALGEAIDLEEALSLGASEPDPAPPPPPVPWDLAKVRERLSEARRSKASAGASGKGAAAERAKAQAEVLGRVLDGEPLAEPGERDDTLLRAAGILAFWLPAGAGWAVASQLLRPSIARMDTSPEGFEHWLAVAEQKFSRQAKIREAKDLKREAEEAAVRELARGLSARAAPTPEQISDAGGDWESLLILDKREGIKACEHNAHLLVSCAPELRATLRWNQVTKSIAVRGGPLAGAPQSSLAGLLAGWLQRQYDFMAGEKLVGAALLRVARENSWDPLAEYLSELAWDGVERAEGFFERYLGVTPTDPGNAQYVRAVSKRWLVSLVARALEPGCKVDTVLILEGPQGAGKSTALEKIVGSEYFLDTAVEIGSKDAMQAIAAAWLVELAELASFRRAETLRVRQFLTTKVDKFRLPYTPVTEDSPRRCVFAGTTNSERYLTDREGNRRYWPVRVGAIDLAGIDRDRDQVFAEAVALYRAGERWHLSADETELASAETESRVDESTVEEAIERWWYAEPPVKRPKRFLIVDVAEWALKSTPERVNHTLRIEVGSALKRLGFKRCGKDRHYEPTDEMASAPQRATTLAQTNLMLAASVKQAREIQ